MPTPALAKPASLTGAIISGNFIGTSDTAAKIVLKVERSRYRFWSPIRETTGDGDYDTNGMYVVHENSGLQYFSFALNGFMEGGDTTVGILNIANQNTTANIWKMRFSFSNGQHFPSDSATFASVLIRDLTVDFDATSEVVGIALSGVNTLERFPSDIT